MSENVNIGILSTPSGNGGKIEIADNINFFNTYLLNFTHTQNRKHSVIQNNSSDMGMYVFGGPDNTNDENYNILEQHGSYLALKGINALENPGTFALNSINPDTKERYQLAGLNYGILLWRGNRILSTIEQKSLGSGSWYRIYDDGFIEQGGVGTVSSVGDYSSTITLYKPYKSTIYTIQLTELSESYSGVNTLGIYGSKRTKESFTVLINNIDANGSSGFVWYCAGY